MAVPTPQADADYTASAMITRITGHLESLVGSSALIRNDLGMTFEVLLPAFCAARLGGQIDQTVTLETFFFMESQGQGNTIYPRLAGFFTTEDREFYLLLTTCKGVGLRKALRAMAMPTAQLAAAIADRDTATLQSLPEIGKRTAETIIITLKDKVEGFAAAPSRTSAGGGADGGDLPSATSGDGGLASGGGMVRDAIRVLVDLGESRADATRLIDEVMSMDDRPDSLSDLLSAVYRIRGS